MTRVLATGVFDILHAGHVFYLSEAKRLGTELIVLVTSDKVAAIQKRQPFFNQDERKGVVEALKMVDKVVIGSEVIDYCGTIQTLKPEIVALGYDQTIDEQELKVLLANCGWRGRVIRLEQHPHKKHSTTSIAKSIKQRKEL